MRISHFFLLFFSVLFFATLGFLYKNPPQTLPQENLSSPAEVVKRDTFPPEKTFDTMQPVGKNNYPGLKKGEMFLMNISSTHYIKRVNGSFIGVSDPENASSINLNSIGYKSKRLGKFSCDEKGNKIEGFLPVFILIEDYNEK